MTHAQALRQDAQALRARAATMAQAIHRAPLLTQADAKDAQAADEEASIWAVIEVGCPDPSLRAGEVLEWNLTGWARGFKGQRFTMDRAQAELRRLQDRLPHAVVRMSVARMA